MTQIKARVPLDAHDTVEGTVYRARYTDLDGVEQAYASFDGGGKATVWINIQEAAPGLVEQIADDSDGEILGRSTNPPTDR
jgi:predicted ABC-type ATPase